MPDDFVPFISVNDVQNIQSFTEKASNQFWKTAARLHRRETEFVAVPLGDLIQKPEFDVEAAIIGFSAFAAFEAFSTAELIKLRDLGQEAQIMFLTKEDAIVDPEICEPLNRTVYDVNDPFIPIPIQDTHLHCRCRLVPVVNGEELSSDSETSII